jgi:acyl-CoA synthetase (NDP forming)
MARFSMEKFFNPRSIVVIGASNSPFNIGSTITKFLEYINFKGEIFAVNSKGEDVQGACGFSSVQDLPVSVDLAVVLAPARAVPDIIRDCGLKGIKNVVIETAEFSETGKDGIRLQAEINRYAKEYGIRFLGPNCLGTLNAHEHFCCFFGLVPGMYDEVFDHPGTVSYVIQSGGVGALIIDCLRRDVTNVNKMVSIGNKEDLDESDVVEYFNGDSTEVIGMYLENIKNGRKLIETAKKIEKPILLFKVGRTAEGSRAAISHTAGMANNDVILDHACRQAGIVRLKEISELYTLPKIFTHMPLLKGNRVVVFTNSGAFGGITADILVEAGMRMAVLSPETQEKIRKVGKLFNASNPIDLGLTLSKQAFTDIFEIILSSDEVDALLAIPNVWQQVVIDAIAEFGAICRTYDKPAAIYIPNAVERIISVRTEHQIPVFESPEEAVRALKVSYEHYIGLQKKTGMPLLV